MAHKETVLVGLKDGQHAKLDGVGSFISWNRLVDQLTQTGEIRKGERVHTIRATADGVEYYVERT